MHVSHFDTCVKFFLFIYLFINLAANQAVQKKKYKFSTSKHIFFIFVQRLYPHVTTIPSLPP